MKGVTGNTKIITGMTSIHLENLCFRYFPFISVCACVYTYIHVGIFHMKNLMG